MTGQPYSLWNFPERKLALGTGAEGGQRLAVTGERQPAARAFQGEVGNGPLGVAVPKLNGVL